MPTLVCSQPPPPWLLGDRIVEFQNLARVKGTLPQDDTSSGSSSPSSSSRMRATSSLGSTEGRKSLLWGSGRSPPNPQASQSSCAHAEGGFMRNFFDTLNESKRLHAEGRDNLRRLAAAHDQLLRATTKTQEGEAAHVFASHVEEIDSLVAAQKNLLDRLTNKPEQEGASESGAELRIRANLQQAAVRKHRQFLLDFRDAQQNFKEALEARQMQQMRLLCPDASEEEMRQMAEVGETASQLVARRMAGAHAMLLEELRRCQEKHADILRLERGVADLAQMFQEVAILVDSQGEMLDTIEANVHTVNVVTKKAEKELITTRKYQRSTRKWQCWLTAFMMILALIILFPIIMNVL